LGPGRPRSRAALTPRAAAGSRLCSPSGANRHPSASTDRDRAPKSDISDLGPEPKRDESQLGGPHTPRNRATSAQVSSAVPWFTPSSSSVPRTSAGVHGGPRLAESVLYPIEAAIRRRVTRMSDGSSLRCEARRGGRRLELPAFHGKSPLMPSVRQAARIRDHNCRLTAWAWMSSKRALMKSPSKPNWFALAM
jgi:hypothetical protein